MASELAAQLVADRRCRIVDAGRRGRAVAELASRQRGIVARAQLLAIGFGPGAIAGRLQSGVLHSIHRGVYAFGHRALVPGAVELAAALACGRDAVVSHADAAHLYELLPYPARRTPVNITVPRESCPARPGIQAHRTRAFGLGEIGTLDGIPITSPARTILDLAAENPQQLERALAEAQARRLVTDSDLSRLLARYPGRPGSRRFGDCSPGRVKRFARVPRPSGASWPWSAGPGYRLPSRTSGLATGRSTSSGVTEV